MSVTGAIIQSHDSVFVNSFGCEGRFMKDFKHPSGLAFNKDKFDEDGFYIFVIIL